MCSRSMARGKEPFVGGAVPQRLEELCCDRPAAKETRATTTNYNKSNTRLGKYIPWYTSLFSIPFFFSSNFIISSSTTSTNTKHTSPPAQSQQQRATQILSRALVSPNFSHLETDQIDQIDHDLNHLVPHVQL